MPDTIYYNNWSGSNTGWSIITGTGTLFDLPSNNGGSNSSGYSNASADKAVCIVPSIDELNEFVLTGQVNSNNKINLILSFGYYRLSGVNDITVAYSINGGANYTNLSYTSPPDDTWTLITIPLPSNCNRVSDIYFKISHQHVGLPFVFDVFIDDFLITAESPMYIKDTPQQYEPVHNDLPFVVSGTNNTQTNYKYWMDVYFPGSTSYDYRLFTFPRPDGFGSFNLKTILRDYVTGDLDIESTEGFRRASDMYKAYNVYFGESYGTTGSITSGIVSSGTYYTYDGSLEWAEFISYSQNDRAMMATTGRAFFLTNLVQTTALDLTQYNLIGDSENAWVYMAAKESNSIHKALIATYDSAGNSLGSYSITNPYYVLTDHQNRFLRFPCGTANIPLIPTADITVTSGSLPIITSSVVYIAIVMQSLTAQLVSKYIIFKVQSNCSKYDSYRLHYKNKWGGFDSFTFTMVNKESGEIERKSFKKMYGDISSDGNWSYTKKDRGITNYSTKGKRKLLLKSNWVTESEYELLIELIESPQVYWDNSGELFAVNILNSSYEVKTIKKDKIFNLELDVEFTQMNRRQ